MIKLNSLKLSTASMLFVVKKYLNNIDKTFSSKLKKISLFQKLTEVYNKNAKLIQNAYSYVELYSQGKETKTPKNIYTLQSIFNELLNNKPDQYKYLQVKPLSLEKSILYPNTNTLIDKSQINEYIEKFLKEMGEVEKFEQVYFVILKYFYNLPFKNTKNCDISVFDVAKLTAALAVCLNVGDKKFMLIRGDMSGIQDYIFAVTSKGASKSLKGRSMYISLLSDIISKFIVRQLKLSKCNILYNGGGNFYLLASPSHKDSFLKLRKQILNNLLNAHRCKIYIALSYKEFEGKDLKNFSNIWQGIGQESGILKSRKWSEIGLYENYDLIFGEQDRGTDNDLYICPVCGNVTDKIIKNEKGCSFCESFQELTKQLKSAKFYLERNIEIKKVDKINTYRDVINSFGYEIKFSETKDETYSNYIINNTDFIEKKYDGYVFKVVNLPDGDFDDIACKGLKQNTKYTGDKKLGVLKLDVDNLGKIFISGLGTKNNIIRIMTLSRMMGLFFEGKIYSMIKEEKLQNKIYVVYSGGDDTFLVGAYNEVFEFAYKLRKNFEKFVCNNPKVTFSAGIGLFDTKYPMIRAADETEEYLEKAKNYFNNKEKHKKDKVTIFGQTFTWHEYKAIMDIRDKCEKIVELSNKRAVLNKILKSTKGFKSVMNDVDKHGKVGILKIHRLAYYLRELRNDEKTKNEVEELVEIYENIVFQSLINRANNEEYKNINNIMVIPCAVKWAELNTRNYNESGDLCGKQ